FQSEIPAPWPEWQQPSIPFTRPLGLRTLFRSRFTLGAAAVILLFGQIWLFRAYKVYEPPLAKEKAPSMGVAEKIAPNKSSERGSTISAREKTTPLQPTKNMR